MKILFFVSTLAAGGKERRLTELMKSLNLNQDINFELVVMSREIHYKEVLDMDIHIHYLIRKTKKDISSFQQFYRICKDFRPDIVHCWDSMTAVYSIITCKLLKIKLINGMVVDTPVQQNILNKYWFRARLTFPFSNIIIGNSNAGLAAYNAPIKKSICIYNGMDMARFHNLEAPSLVRKEIFGEASSSFFIAGMVAAFEDRKDYKTLIKAAITLIERSDNLRFILIGDGSKFNEVKKSVPPLLLNKIIFLGRRSNVETIINVFNVGILLTNAKVHGEGISNSLIEYMALGKPVIATKGGGTNEVVLDNQNGYLIDPNNEKQLIERIEEFIKQNKLLDEFGKKSRQIVLEKFNLNIMANHYVLTYKKLLKKEAHQ